MRLHAVFPSVPRGCADLNDEAGMRGLKSALINVIDLASLEGGRHRRDGVYHVLGPNMRGFRHLGVYGEGVFD